MGHGQIHLYEGIAEFERDTRPNGHPVAVGCLGISRYSPVPVGLKIAVVTCPIPILYGPYGIAGSKKGLLLKTPQRGSSTQAEELILIESSVFAHTRELDPGTKDVVRSHFDIAFPFHGDLVLSVLRIPCRAPTRASFHAKEVSF